MHTKYDWYREASPRARALEFVVDVFKVVPYKKYKTVKYLRNNMYTQNISRVVINRFIAVDSQFVVLGRNWVTLVLRVRKKCKFEMFTFAL